LGVELTEFTRTDELAAIGSQTTMEALPQIQKLLSQLDGELFAPPALSHEQYVLQAKSRVPRLGMRENVDVHGLCAPG